MKLKIQDIMRANYVHRWQLVNVSRYQTVAEHSFNVAMLSKAMLEKMNADPQVIDQCVKHALMHDIDEVVVGDIPTPTKKRVRLLGVEINDIVGSYTPDCYKEVIKAADYLDAMLFLHENGQGRHAKAVFEDIQENYRVYVMSCKDDVRIASNAVRLAIFHGEFVI